MPPIAAGSRFGPYEILAPLGSGGMGEVYRARDERIGRQVALKVLTPRFAADAERLRRFEQEARTSGLLNHPNIVTLFDVGAHEGLPYLVCELLEGETLRERMARGRIPPSEAVGLAVQAARGLAAAHARGIVHRDLKPENLFLARDGTLKLLDFGVAKLVQPEPGRGEDTITGTGAGAVVGTVAYMSPEQVSGGAVDPRSDFFAFGAVLYEMLAGLRPFVADTPAETMTAILRQDPAPVASTNPAVPPALECIVMHCLEKAPENRFQSARDLAFALDALAGADARSLPRPSGPSTPAARGRAATVRVGLLLACCSVGLGLVWAAHTAPGGQTPTFSRVIRLVATDANESAPVLSPDGKWIAYIADAGQRPDIWVRFLAGGQTINLTGGDRDVLVVKRRDIGGLDISPDGTQIVFDGGPASAAWGQISPYVMPAPLGGTPRKLLAHGRGVRWSPDGRSIAYMVPGGPAGDSIWLADATGEHPRELLPVSGGIHAHWLAWSADGEYLYFNYGVNSSNLEPTGIWRVGLTGGRPEPVVASSRRAIYPCPSTDGRGLLYSSNPNSVELALWWKPFAGDAVRITTGVGEYAEARLSRDGRSMVATAYAVRHSLATLAVAGGPAPPTPLLPGATGDLDATLSPERDRLAFSSTRSGDRNIWTARLDGSDARLVTSGPAIDERPAWAPDGRQIAFVSDRGGQRGIWLTDADGGTPRQVITAQVLDTITWAPDGSELVYAAPNGELPSLFAVPVSGGPPQLVPTPAGATAPAWSAAGHMIAYIEPRPTTGRPNHAPIAFVTRGGEVPRPPLTDGPSLGNGSLAWSPDGRSLAGVVDPGGVPAAVWLIPLEGAARQLAELGQDRRPRGIAWAPDDRLIFGLVERTGDVVLFDQGGERK